MKKIKILVMDVDGTLTDGCIYMGPQGEAMKAFNAQDGYGIAQIPGKSHRAVDIAHDGDHHQKQSHGIQYPGGGKPSHVLAKDHWVKPRYF